MCNYDKYNDISNYKVSLISNVRILNEDCKDIKTLNNMENFSVKNYINEHIYMTYGESVEAELELESSKYISEIIDWLGDKVWTRNSKDNKVTVSLKVNEQALIYWALQYGEHVEILSPESTREKMKNMLKLMTNKYND